MHLYPLSPFTVCLSYKLVRSNTTKEAAVSNASFSHSSLCYIVVFGCNRDQEWRPQQLSFFCLVVRCCLLLLRMKGFFLSFLSASSSSSPAVKNLKSPNKSREFAFLKSFKSSFFSNKPLHVR